VLVNQNLINAQITLSPAHLEPLGIRIAPSDGQESVAITTHCQVTREGPEAAALKLRDTLGQQGFGGVSVEVAQRQLQDRTPQTAAYEPVFFLAAGAKAASVEVPVSGERTA
jgi:flagellar hook-length control protein FliK